MNELARKKKKGFTLIELIAVIAIIGILAAVLVPKVLGYMEDAKKSKVKGQARQVVLIYETYNGKETTALTEGTTLAALRTAVGTKYDNYGVITSAKLDLIGVDTVTIAQCRAAADGKDSAGGTRTIKLDANGTWKGDFVEGAIPVATP